MAGMAGIAGRLVAMGATGMAGIAGIAGIAGMAGRLVSGIMVLRSPAAGELGAAAGVWLGFWS